MSTGPWDDEIEAIRIATEDDPVAIEYGEVLVGGLAVPVYGNVTVQQLGMFGGRFVIGDPTKDADQYFSLWNQDTWTGGGQVGEIDEASDSGRFRHSTLETLHPNMLTLQLETTAHTITTPDGDGVCLGDYEVDSTVLFWAAFGTDLCYYDTETGEFASPVDSLTAEPYGNRKGLVYDDLLFIPLGPSGFDVWDGVAITNYTNLQVVAFNEWDDKLIALGLDGQISIYNGDTWNSPFEMKLRGRRTPRNLVLWWTPERKAALFLVTNRDVWACDFLSFVLYRTGLKFPVHPDFGLGSASWQDDAMYVSVGVGMHQFTLGGVISAMGLDRRNGLPADLRGKIVDLEPEYNGLLALIEGVGTAVIADESMGDVLEETMMFDDSPIVPVAGTIAKSTLQRYNGQGWHTVWESAGSSGDPTNVMVSEADGEYRLWWGYGTSMYTQPLRRSFYNPAQGAELGLDRFAASGSHKTGRFDGNMAMFLKQASHLTCHLHEQSTQTINVLYQTDLSYPDWITLGQFMGTGEQYLMFDPDGDGDTEGDPYHWIEFDFQFESNTALETPIAQWFTLHFIKVPLQTKAFSFRVPLNFGEDGYSGRSNEEIAEQLDTLATTGPFIRFMHCGRNYRVRVASVTGEDVPGIALKGYRDVHLIQLDRPPA